MSMLNKYLIISLISFISLFSYIPEQRERPYTIIPLLKNTTISINGSVEEKEWLESFKITKFKSPWQECEIPQTGFYICSDKTFLYFAFKVTDENIIVIPGKEDNVALGDRVEIFFSKDRKLSKYYCLEISPCRNILDYKASFYRFFDNKWDCSDLLVKTSVSEKGYEVECRLPLSSLNIKDECFYMGVYRADFDRQGQEEVSALWLTWIDPLLEQPDFHIPSSFQKVCIK